MNTENVENNGIPGELNKLEGELNSIKIVQSNS
jgi:hypothetical protein